MSGFDPINSRSLFVVGDDGQSIYAFRGARPENIFNLSEFYPESKKIVLNQNYRSTTPILQLAEQILSHNPKQFKKDLFTTNPDNTQVYYHLAINERAEAEYIVRQLYELYIKKITQKQEKPLNYKAENNQNTKKLNSVKYRRLLIILDKLDLKALKNKLT